MHFPVYLGVVPWGHTLGRTLGVYLGAYLGAYLGGVPWEQSESNPGAIWEQSGSNLGEEAKGAPGRNKHVKTTVFFCVFSCATDHFV